MKVQSFTAAASRHYHDLCHVACCHRAAVLNCANLAVKHTLTHGCKLSWFCAGCTMFLERKIVGRLDGEAAFQFGAAQAWASQASHRRLLLLYRCCFFGHNTADAFAVPVLRVIRSWQEPSEIWELTTHSRSWCQTLQVS